MEFNVSVSTINVAADCKVTIIRGKMGSGKTFKAVELTANALAQGKNIVCVMPLMHHVFRKRELEEASPVSTPGTGSFELVSTLEEAIATECATVVIDDPRIDPMPLCNTYEEKGLPLDLIITVEGNSEQDRAEDITLSVEEQVELANIISKPVWDGNLVSKATRDSLEEKGLVVSICGLNVITEFGVMAAKACDLKEYWAHFN